MRQIIAFLVIIVSFNATSIAADDLLKQVQTIPLDGVQGRFDHFGVDANAKRLYVAALGNNTVEVIDLAAGKRIHSISKLHEPQGLAYAPTTNRLFVTYK